MLNYEQTTENMFGRGVTFSVDEYFFCLSLVLGEEPDMAYAMTFRKDDFSKVVGTEDERDFLLSVKHDCDALIALQSTQLLRTELEDLYRADVQQRALNLEDYRFTGGQIAQILQNLLHNRISDLDSASTKDVISLIKMLTERFGLDGGGDFERHFIQVYPKFNALCTNCNREFQVVEGLGAVCPHCGAKYYWDVERLCFIPRPATL